MMMTIDSKLTFNYESTVLLGKSILTYILLNDVKTTTTKNTGKQKSPFHCIYIFSDGELLKVAMYSDIFTRQYEYGAALPEHRSVLVWHVYKAVFHAMNSLCH